LRGGERKWWWVWGFPQWQLEDLAPRVPNPRKSQFGGVELIHGERGEDTDTDVLRETPPMVLCISLTHHCLPVILDASRQPSECKRKRFPPVESQHKAEGLDEEARNSVALVMLTVDSVLKVERVVDMREGSLSNRFPLAMPSRLLTGPSIQIVGPSE